MSRSKLSKHALAIDGCLEALEEVVEDVRTDGQDRSRAQASSVKQRLVADGCNLCDKMDDRVGNLLVVGRNTCAERVAHLVDRV